MIKGKLFCLKTYLYKGTRIFSFRFLKDDTQLCFSKSDFGIIFLGCLSSQEAVQMVVVRAIENA